MSVITPATLTDGMIRGLRANTGWVGKQCEADQQTFAVALSTPKSPDFDANAREAARQKVCDMLNARSRCGYSGMVAGERCMLDAGHLGAHLARRS